MPRAPEGSPLGAFAAPFARSRQPMYVLDARTLRFLAVNAAALRFYGWSRPEFLKKTLLAVRRGGEAQAKRTVRSHGLGLPWVGEVPHRKKNGRVVDVRVFSFPIDYEGRAAWVSTVVPVPRADRVEASRLAAASGPELLETASLPLLFQHSPLPMWVFDLQTYRFLAVNDAAVQLYGYSRRDFRRLKLSEIRPKEDLPGFARTVSREARRHIYHVGVWRHLKKDGSIIQVDVRALDVTFAGRRARLAMLNDVTERRKLEREREQAQQRLAAVVDSAPIILFANDLKGRITLSQGQALRAIGRKPGESVGDNVFKGRHHNPRLSAATRRALRGESFSMDLPVGDRIFSTAYTPLRGENGRLEGTVGVAMDVTESRRLEDALRESERRCRGLYTKTPAMLHSIDRQGRLVSVSDHWLRTLGYRREEVLGRRSTEFLTPASARYAREKILPEFYRTGVTIEAPYQMVKKTGEVIDVLLSASAERDADGRVLRSLAVLTDVTQRKRVEAELRLTKAVVDSSADGIVATDDRGRFIKVNGAFERLTGYSSAELIGRSFQSITAPEHRAAGDHVFVRLSQRRGPVTFEKEYRRKDGTRVPVQLTIFPVRGSDGRHVAFASIVKDITAQKRAEQATHELLSLNEATLESTADGLLVVDLKGRITGFNRRFAEMWRIPKRVLEAGGDHHKALKYARLQLKDPSAFVGKVKRLYANPEDESFDVLELKDGRAFERFSRPQKIGPRTVGRVWSFRDITERRRLEKEIAETSAREQAKLGRDLHDSIGQTLTAVSLGLKALQRKLPEDGSGVAEVGRLESLTRLAIQQVRDVARGLLPHELQAGDVGASLRALSAGARRIFGVSCDVVVRGDPKLDDNATAVQLYRIAQEALNNAAKHSHARADVRISFEGGDKRLKLIVRDEGVGIATRRRAGGPGVGIAIMQHRAESLGGSLVVRRAAGGGTEVICECPRPGAPS